MAGIDDPTKVVPLKVFTFLVAHPSLHPPHGAIVELEAPDFTAALLAIAGAMPGIHVIKLVREYWKHLEGGTA